MGTPRKYRNWVSMGVGMELAELHALRKVATRENRPAGELIRGLVLLLLERLALYSTEPEAADGATLRVVKRLLSADKEKER